MYFGKTVLRTLGRLVICLIAMLLMGGVASSSSQAADRILTLTPEHPVRLLGNVDSAIDRSGRLSVEDVAGGRLQGWSRSEPVWSVPAWEENAVWYRFTPARPGDTPLALAWPAAISRVDLYWPSGNGHFEHRAGGFDVKLRPVSQHLLMIPDRAYGKIWYVRVLTGDDQTSPRLEDVQLALQEDVTLLSIFGGFFAAILLVNLALYLVMREKPLLVYAAVMATLLGLLGSDDAIWRFEPSTAFMRLFVHDLFGWLYFAGTAIFARVFLNLSKTDPVINRWLMILTVASVLGVPADVFGLSDALQFSTQAILIALLVLVVVAGIRSVRAGYRPARFLVAGVVGVTIGAIANFANANWGLPLGRAASYLFEVSIGWEALLLTVALADRMNAIAKQNAALQTSRAELQRLATRDALTGIPNRRAFDERLAEEWQRAQRGGGPVALIMIDVDNFKRYNDAFGHIVGDACLSRIANACAGTLKRSSDFFARYGGEEFAAIVITQSDADLDVLAERMRAAVEAEGIEHPGNPGGIATISLGSAALRPGSGDNTGILIALADGALYAAKSGGRNRVVRATEGPAPSTAL